MKAKLITLFTVLITLFFTACSKPQRVSPGFVKTPSPGMNMTGGFLKLVNNGTGSIALTQADCDAAGITELHEMIMEGDMMKMRKIDKIEVPPKKSVELKPGGLHLMLLNIKSELTAGTEVNCKLTFSDNKEVHVLLPVKDLPEMGHSHD